MQHQQTPPKILVTLHPGTRCAGCSASRSVIVIGAGFSGLAAARRLLEEGPHKVQITVLEGGSRLGGRAWTRTLPDLGKAEFGAT